MERNYNLCCLCWAPGWSSKELMETGSRGCCPVLTSMLFMSVMLMHQVIRLVQIFSVVLETLDMSRALLRWSYLILPHTAESIFYPQKKVLRDIGPLWIEQKEKYEERTWRMQRLKQSKTNQVAHCFVSVCHPLSTASPVLAPGVCTKGLDLAEGLEGRSIKCSRMAPPNATSGSDSCTNDDVIIVPSHSSSEKKPRHSVARLWQRHGSDNG